MNYRLLRLAIAAALVSACGLAVAASFAEVKRRADDDERGLSTVQIQSLAEAQGRVAALAFANCVPRPAPQLLPAFVVVMELDVKGKVVRTWRRGDSEIAACIERQFSGATLFRPPTAPFFTSFDFNPKQ